MVRGERLTSLAGPVWAVLFVAAALVISNYEFMPPAGEVADFYQSGSARVMTGAYLGLLSTPFLVLFSGSISTALRRNEEAPSSLAAAVLGGGVLAAGLIAVGFVATIAGAERTMLRGPIDPDVAAAFFDLSSLSASASAFGFAALLGGFALGGTDADFPRWLTRSSGVIAVGLLSPVNYIVLGLLLVWVPYVAAVLFRRARHEESASPGRVEAARR
jgi:hypothetical protein